ncbi:hypothetical protein EVAR_13714_1 [Eumeta japonica]|uniref:Uncharacterized protein n=1 Tax=Eumeta variegata TaxID=151549 RepID=A0A4C1UCA8_EUMVA|nr:hypothetical protein EVAR_13714_1 [Eumeta japonica]
MIGMVGCGTPNHLPFLDIALSSRAARRHNDRTLRKTPDLQADSFYAAEIWSNRFVAHKEHRLLLECLIFLDVDNTVQDNYGFDKFGARNHPLDDPASVSTPQFCPRSVPRLIADMHPDLSSIETFGGMAVLPLQKSKISWLHERLTTKLGPKFEGSMEVLEGLSNDRCRLKHVTLRGRFKKIVSHDSLRAASLAQRNPFESYSEQSTVWVDDNNCGIPVESLSSTLDNSNYANVPANMGASNSN